MLRGATSPEHHARLRTAVVPTIETTLAVSDRRPSSIGRGLELVRSASDGSLPAVTV